VSRASVYLFKNDGRATTDQRALFCAERFDPKQKGRLRIARARSGKPVFFGQTGLHFSVSHCEGLFVCAVAEIAVGVDAEPERPVDREKIARRFFHEQEASYLAACEYRDFFSVWTAKESYVKLTGEGITDRFSRFTVVGEGGLCGKEMGVFFCQRVIAPKITLSLCTRKPISELQIFDERQADIVRF